MLLFAKAFIVVIAFLTTINSNIIINNNDYTKSNYLNLKQSDVQVLFEGKIPMEGIKGSIMSAIPEEITSPPKNKTIFDSIKNINYNFGKKMHTSKKTKFPLAVLCNCKSSSKNVCSNGNELKIFLDLYNSRNHVKEPRKLIANVKMNLLLPFTIIIILLKVYFIEQLRFIANWIMNFCGLSNPKLPATNIFTTQSFFKGFQYETCVICLDDYEEGDQLQVMPCCHAYHSECIKLWLMQKQVVCPICKRQVVKSFEDVHFEGLFDIEPN